MDNKFLNNMIKSGWVNVPDNVFLLLNSKHDSEDYKLGVELLKTYIKPTEIDTKWVRDFNGKYSLQKYWCGTINNKHFPKIYLSECHKDVEYWSNFQDSSINPCKEILLK